MIQHPAIEPPSKHNTTRTIIIALISSEDTSTAAALDKEKWESSTHRMLPWCSRKFGVLRHIHLRPLRLAISTTGGWVRGGDRCPVIYGHYDSPYLQQQVGGLVGGGDRCPVKLVTFWVAVALAKAGVCHGGRNVLGRRSVGEGWGAAWRLGNNV